MKWLPLDQPPERACNVLLFYGTVDMGDDLMSEARDVRLHLGFYDPDSPDGAHWKHLGTAHDAFEDYWIAKPTLYAVVTRP